MSPVDPLDREIQETGARTLLDKLASDRDLIDIKRAAIVAKYPHLATATLRGESPVLSKRARIDVNNAPRYAEDIVALARNDARELAKAKRKKRKRTHYDEEFKAAAILRVKDGDWLVDVAESEGVRPSVLRYWCEAAGVPVPLMPWEERRKRMQAGRKGLPAPTTKLLLAEKADVAHVKKPKKVVALTGSQKNSIRIGLNLLSGMPDAEDIHYTALGKKIGVTDKNVYWHLRKRKEAGHVKLVSKGTYRKTAKGKKYQEETPVP